jgi:ribosomal protein S18 acetylase RimI-like enzyme
MGNSRLAAPARLQDARRVPEPVQYRRGTPDDAPGIAFVNITTWKTSYRGVVHDAFLDSLAVDGHRERLRKRFDQVPYDCFVATEAGTVVGYADFGPPRDGPPRYAWELYAIYVLPEHQGRGVGRRLVRLGMDAMRERGVDTLFIRVLEGNPFRKFYEKLGGRPIGFEEIVIGGQPYKEVLYGWDALPAV